MKVSSSRYEAVRAALEEYKKEVEATKLTPSSKWTYITHAKDLVQWLNDDFEPGARLK